MKGISIKKYYDPFLNRNVKINEHVEISDEHYEAYIDYVKFDEVVEKVGIKEVPEIEKKEKSDKKKK